MTVHFLFILREGGTTIYGRDFSKQLKNLNVDLISPFFSAIFSFSRSVLSKQLEVLEMGDLRFIIKKEKEFIFVILSDTRENLLFINSRLENIIFVFLQLYNQMEDLHEGQMIISSDLDNIIDTIVQGGDEIIQVKNTSSYKNIFNYFNELVSNGEIIGAALVTGKGTTIFSSLSEDILLRAMRELEIRYMSGTFDLPELFYILADGKKVCERILNLSNLVSLLLIIQFDPNTKLGMVDLSVELIVEKIMGFMK